jgi:hypothetical protein
MTLPNNLEAIITKVRNLTARNSDQQITDQQIIGYINTYYLYDMPESLRLLKLKDVYSFITTPNVEYYPFPSEQYITVEGPAYCGGQQMNYFQDNDQFYRQWPKINNLQIVATGNGTAGPYTFYIPGTPFMQSINTVGLPNNYTGTDIRVLLSANIAEMESTSVIDNGMGGFVAAPGSIDYITGMVTVTFPAIVPPGAPINSSTIPYVASLPRAILMFQNQFILRPIPDQSYLVEVNAFRFPTQLINDADTPELFQWWQLLAYGAAIKILSDNADWDNANAIRPYLEEQLRMVQRRTIKQQTNQRSQTIYNQSGYYSVDGFYPFY